MTEVQEEMSSSDEAMRFVGQRKANHQYRSSARRGFGTWDMVIGLTPVLSTLRVTLGIGRYPCTGAQVLLVVSNETNGPIIESVSIGQDIKEYEDHLVAR
jgi:hypothetical protein